MSRGDDFIGNTASREEAAAYLGISVSTLAQWASKKEGPPYYLIGMRARYRYRELDQFIETKRQNNGTA